MTINKKVINYKILDLVKLYNFGVKFVLIQDRIKNYNFYVRPIVGAGHVITRLLKIILGGRMMPSPVPKNLYLGAGDAITVPRNNGHF